MCRHDTLSNMLIKIDKITKKIFYNTVSQFGSKVISVILSLFSVSLLTRYLGAAGYGDFTLVFTYLSFFALIADLGFNVTLVREFSRQKNISVSVKTTFLNVKLVLVFLSAVVTLIALKFFPYSNFLKTAIIIGTVVTIIGNMISYGTSILQSKLRLDLVALIDVITKIVTVIAVVYFIYIKSSFYYIIGAILIGNIAGLSVTICYIRDYLVLKCQIDRKLLQSLFKLAIPLGITSVLSLFYFKIDTLLLSVLKTPTDVGIYGLAYNILENILMLWGLIMASVFPLLSKFHGQNDIVNYKNLVRKTLIILVIMSAMIIIFGNLFDFLIMRILGGSKFFASMQPFKILLWSVPFFFLNNVFYNVIVSFGKTKHLISPLIFAVIVNLALNLYAIPKYGYIGSSVTTVITEIGVSVFYLVVFIRSFKTEVAEYIK
jgi:O-antigen/teichoic acid export membrane protein